jgi:hypothetical protein
MSMRDEGIVNIQKINRVFISRSTSQMEGMSLRFSFAYQCKLSHRGTAETECAWMGHLIGFHVFFDHQFARLITV